MPASQEYVDSTGSRSTSCRLPLEPSRSSSATAEKVAALVHDAALSEDPALLDAVSSAAGLALENERLLAELRAQLDGDQRLASTHRRSRRHRATATRTQPPRRRPTAPRHPLPPPAHGAGDPARRPGGRRNDARRRRRRPQARARRAPRARPRPPPSRPHRPRPRTRAPVARDSRTVPGRDHRRPARRLPEAVEAAIYYVVAESLTNAAKHAGRIRGAASSCRRPPRQSSSRSATTAAAARTWPAARGSAGSPTASKRSADGSSSRARSEPEPSSGQSCHCAEPQTAAPAERRRPTPRLRRGAGQPRTAISAACARRSSGRPDLTDSPNVCRSSESSLGALGTVQGRSRTRAWKRSSLPASVWLAPTQKSTQVTAADALSSRRASHGHKVCEPPDGAVGTTYNPIA